ncbi:Cellular repressor of transcription [Handroanthus impetiginosus]|uniref:Cellular repressor of transcription n=1 Tax=Handroanthus impetiginosus TaxID=429701 RepID=A0A2G9HB60_9LAMI|nr:Cellular repressor of transcription [Handroanthus impetiginosus]
MKTIKESINLHMTFLLAPLIFLFLITPQVLAGPPASRPDPEDAPVFARWLVNQGSWGVLGTLAQGRVPFGNVMSYSDGGSGFPYFYLSTTLDPTGFYALRNPWSSLTLSEYTLGTCNQADPQSPVCAKITLSGRLRLLPQNSKEAAFAEAALFADHPQLAGFPKQRGFRVFKLVITNIFLVNKYAPPRNLTVYQYLHSII